MRTGGEPRHVRGFKRVLALGPLDLAVLPPELRHFESRMVALNDGNPHLNQKCVAESVEPRVIAEGLAAQHRSATCLPAAGIVPTYHRFPPVRAVLLKSRLQLLAPPRSAVSQCDMESRRDNDENRHTEIETPVPGHGAPDSDAIGD